MTMRRVILRLVFASVGVSVSVSGSGGCRSSPPPDLESVKQWVREEFPDVEQVSTEELARSLASGEGPVLLDVREEAEYAVSHLPGALRVAPGASIPPHLDTLDRDAAIVAYCSVGYRSSRLVAELEARGFTNVSNLEGSIFQWANEGRPLEKDGEPTDKVHPFDEEWGRLLREDLRAHEGEK